MRKLSLSGWRGLYGRPVEGYIVYGHPNEVELRKGYIYVKEFRHVSGAVADFINNIVNAVKEILSMFKAKDGSDACELLYVGEKDVTIGSETKKHALCQFRVKKDIDRIEGDTEKLKMMGIDVSKPGPQLIPLLAGLILGGVIGFFLGMAVGITLIVLGLLIGGDLGAGLVSMGLGIITFSVTSGWYKALSLPLFGAGAYFFARFFGVIKSASPV